MESTESPSTTGDTAAASTEVSIPFSYGGPMWVAFSYERGTPVLVLQAGLISQRLSMDVRDYW